MDADARASHPGEQVREVGVDLAIRPKPLDVGSLNDERDVGFVSRNQEFFEATEVASTAFGLSIGELGHAVFDVRAGFDLDVGEVAIRRFEQEVASAVVGQWWFAAFDRVPLERRKFLRDECLLEEIVGERGTNADVDVAIQDGDGVVVRRSIRVVDRRAQYLTTGFEDRPQRTRIAEIDAFWVALESNPDDEAVGSIDDPSTEEIAIDGVQGVHGGDRAFICEVEHERCVLPYLAVIDTIILSHRHECVPLPKQRSRSNCSIESMNRVIVVISVAVLVVLAGCAGVETALDGEGDDLLDETDVEDTGENTDDEDDEDDPPDVDGELEIHHIDVGQADSTLIVTPDGETILLDTGDWRQDGSGVIAYLESEGIDRIDHLVATHGHADHIGGHAAIIEHFETEAEGIGNVYDSGVPHDSATYENYLDAVEDHGLELLLVEEGDELPIDDHAVGALVLNPPAGDSGTDLHYNSVTLVVEFGDVRYLTTGDAEADAEDRLVDEWGDELDADVYQAGHHGSSTSSTESFMDAVDPAIAVMSSNFDSQYGHPHDEVLEDFADRGLETYWTGVHGDVVVTTDGEEIDVETSEEFSTDAADLLEEKPEDEDDDSYSLPGTYAHSSSTVLAAGAIQGASDPIPAGG